MTRKNANFIIYTDKIRYRLYFLLKLFFNELNLKKRPTMFHFQELTPTWLLVLLAECTVEFKVAKCNTLTTKASRRCNKRRVLSARTGVTQSDGHRIYGPVHANWWATYGTDESWRVSKIWFYKPRYFEIMRERQEINEIIISFCLVRSLVFSMKFFIYLYPLYARMEYSSASLIKSKCCRKQGNDNWKLLAIFVARQLLQLTVPAESLVNN